MSIAPGPDGLILEEHGTGPALYCLHGLGGGAHWFRGLATRLAGRFRVVALDLPGTGANRPGHAPYSIERCVAALVEHLARRESGPVSLLGHSMGTILALHARAVAPERIRSLLFVGGLPSITPAMRKRLSERREIILRQGMAGLGRKATEGVFSRASLDSAPETAALFARLWEGHAQDAYVEGLEALLSASADGLVAGARVPCLVLAGREDAYAPPAEVGAFARALPGPVRAVELENCGHMTFLEAPARFAREVSDFLTLPDAPPR